MWEFQSDRGKKVRHFVCRNHIGCAEAHRSRPEQNEYGEGIFRGPCHRQCCPHARTYGRAMPYDLEFVFWKKSVKRLRKAQGWGAANYQDALHFLRMPPREVTSRRESTRHSG